MKITELQNRMIAISGTLKGVKLFKNDVTSNNIENQIIGDLTSYYDDLDDVIVNIEIEDYKDKRTFYDCAMIQIEMLIIFDKGFDTSNIIQIKKYLEKTFVEEI
ncbi:hypothetical protein ACFSKN_04685 [Mariniflexile gromovii]|uniref:Uncharacterized protein n=1 Tax=Mariniflexile gromovii TaxID=362523 RepID=A0ABS4BXV8_9FLAO|nr:hypothetical protein [Mariniflexile gromovii]MBP0904856.1 hypothetical protein [Mariniflexile gromovii]